jgi:hypothetical protein
MHDSLFAKLTALPTFTHNIESERARRHEETVASSAVTKSARSAQFTPKKAAIPSEAADIGYSLIDEAP